MARAALRPVLLVCDVQERFRALVHEFDSVERVAATLTRVAALLRVPVVATEQNPARLGPTVPGLARHLSAAGAAVFPKMAFSMLEPPVTDHLDAVCPGVTDAILVGIESHVCVQQTALELLARGKRPWVVVDGVSSQRTSDRSVALATLRQQGALLTTTEALVMELLRTAAHPQFKSVHAVLMEHNAARSALGPV